MKKMSSAAVEEDEANRRAALEAYARRFRRVLAYVDEHIDDELSVDTLSRIAGVSRFHFQRQFSRLFGLGAHQYVQLLRMRRASFQIAFREHRVTDVAFDAGYASHEAFTRAFRKSLGQSPSEFRTTPDWETWFDVQDRLRAVRNRDSIILDVEDVPVERFAGARVAALEHRGDPKQLLETVRHFIAWRRGSGISPRAATFNLVYDDPERVEPQDFRFDVCVAVDRMPRDHARAGIVEKIIPATRCARLHHLGRDEELWKKVGALYSTWLPASGEVAGEFPLFLQRVRTFPDVPDHAAETVVFLPLESPTR